MTGIAGGKMKGRGSGRVVMIHPPQLNALDNKQDPPLGILYMAAVLEQEGIEVDVVDLGGVPEERWKEEIPPGEIYGITAYTPSYHHAKKISTLIRELNRDALMVIGGAHPSALPEETLAEGFFDAVAAGESEYSFLECVKEYFRSGEYPRLVRSVPIPVLDLLPFPARHLVSMREYSRTVGGVQAANIISGRGCPYSCGYCYKGVFPPGVRLRSAENVIREVEQVVETYGASGFHFLDDIFTLDKRRLKDLCQGFEKMKIRFRCNSRPGLEKEEDFEMLYRAGCREIAFGIESGSQEILNRVRKGSTVEVNKQTIVNARKAGILTKAYLMIGLPGENEETIEATKRFIAETRPDGVSLYTFVPYPGTPVWQDPRKYGVTITSKEFEKYYIVDRDGFGGVVLETEETSAEELVRLRKGLLEFLRGFYDRACESSPAGH